MPRLVVLESPYRGDDEYVNLERNLEYLNECLKDCLFNHGEAPIASHKLYGHPVTIDTNSFERKTGIEAGLAWGIHAEATVVYTDFEISEGMQFGIDRAKEEGRLVEYRTLRGKSNLNNLFKTNKPQTR